MNPLISFGAVVIAYGDRFVAQLAGTAAHQLPISVILRVLLHGCVWCVISTRPRRVLMSVCQTETRHKLLSALPAGDSAEMLLVHPSRGPSAVSRVSFQASAPSESNSTKHHKFKAGCTNTRKQQQRLRHSNGVMAIAKPAC